jgi:hypothetical protein
MLAGNIARVTFTLKQESTGSLVDADTVTIKIRPGTSPSITTDAMTRASLGTYIYDFDTTGLPAGAYFYLIESSTPYKASAEGSINVETPRVNQ